ncbi:hypothetical protein MA9V1_112 [Chryseobacterium phage MA9V-1]|nr:hypothetical protein MA9V1_112 [Chryseobacterium phage MA9V-1]
MVDLENFLKLPHAEVMGTVKNNQDEHKQSRLQIEIPGFNHDVPNEHKEWIEKATASINNTLDIPAVGDVVYVVATNGQLRWRHLDFFDKDAMNQFVGDDDYLKSVVLTYKNLQKFSSSGHLFVGWADSTGYRVIKDQAHFELRKDNSVLLYNGRQSVHVNNDNISLGSENISAEPGVLGDQNHLSLDMLNDTVKALANLVENHMNQVAIKCKTSPYTGHLAPDFRQFGANFKSRAYDLCGKNASQFPKTLSKIVSLD